MKPLLSLDKDTQQYIRYSTICSENVFVKILVHAAFAHLVLQKDVINFRAMEFCIHEIRSYLKNLVVNFDYFLKEKLPLCV